MAADVDATEQHLTDAVPDGPSTNHAPISAPGTPPAPTPTRKVVEHETFDPKPLKPGEAARRWDDFLMGGPTTNVHPRLGTPDPNRIVSADGSLSIRFGPHEMGSSPTKFHYHEETWSYEEATHTWMVHNTVKRVPFSKGAW